ncbi:MAG: hypothetical protein C4558_10180 [Dehalococcoidia bacterium]|nr:MAG: hypothetical protein C4558_10180 [Dehalococcoidia bacterium]
MKRLLIVAAFVLAALVVLSCDSTPPPPATETVAPDGNAGATGDRAPAGPATPQTESGGGYAYRPQLAYLDADGTAWLVDADGTGRVKLIEKCTGIGSTKRRDVLNGGLVWSPDGGRIACWRDDGSVLAASARGDERAMPFQPGECAAAPRWAARGDLIACEVKGYVSVRGSDGRERVAVKNNLFDEWSWSPAGDALIVAVPPPANHLAWSVVDLGGRVVADIEDAYASSAARFRWDRDGTRIAYPGAAGITVIDVQTGQRQVFQPPARSGLDLRGGAQADWVLGDSTLFVHNYSGAVAIDLGSGAPRALPRTTYGIARLAPDGVRVALAIPVDQDVPIRQHLAIADLQAGTVTPVAGSVFPVEGMGLAAEFVFSGDSSRVCWTPRPGNVPTVQCTVRAGTAEPVSVPVQVEPDVLGRGDPGVLWRAFSPDLGKIAYGTPGLESPAAPQRLRIAKPDGTVVADLGPMLGTLTYSWRPDGVYRPAERN